jgi:hypothetical protein
VVSASIDDAVVAFRTMAGMPAGRRGHFFDAFASRLAEDAIWETILRANKADVLRAHGRGGMFRGWASMMCRAMI